MFVLLDYIITYILYKYDHALCDTACRAQLPADRGTTSSTDGDCLCLLLFFFFSFVIHIILVMQLYGACNIFFQHHFSIFYYIIFLLFSCSL